MRSNVTILFGIFVFVAELCRLVRSNEKNESLNLPQSLQNELMDTLIYVFDTVWHNGEVSISISISLDPCLSFTIDSLLKLL